MGHGGNRWRAVLIALLVVALGAVELPVVASAASSQSTPAKIDPAPLQSAPLSAAQPAPAPQGDWPVGQKGVTAEAASHFVTPTSDKNTTQDLTTPNPTPVRELVEERTATSETWLNADGTRTLQAYREPKFFQPFGSKGFVPIDSSLVADETHPGWVRNAANSWVARFGPLTQGGVPGESGVVVEAGGQTFSFTPQGMTASTVTPVVDAAVGTVTYPGVWPNVDVRYTVKPGAVKEEVVVNGPTDRASFGFETSGVSLSADSSDRNPGGLVSDGAGVIRVASPSVEAKGGQDITDRARPGR
jgi:hypothetical protein